MSPNPLYIEHREQQKANNELKMCTCVCVWVNARMSVCLLGVRVVHRLHGDVGGAVVATGVLTA